MYIETIITIFYRRAKRGVDKYHNSLLSCFWTLFHFLSKNRTKYMKCCEKAYTYTIPWGQYFAAPTSCGRIHYFTFGGKHEIMWPRGDEIMYSISLVVTELNLVK